MAREHHHRPHRNDPAASKRGSEAAPDRSEAQRLRDAAAALARICPLCSGSMRAVAQRGGPAPSASLGTCAGDNGLLACASCGFAFET